MVVLIELVVEWGGCNGSSLMELVEWGVMVVLIELVVECKMVVLLWN